jgi:hypothetical protein
MNMNRNAGYAILMLLAVWVGSCGGGSGGGAGTAPAAAAAEISVAGTPGSNGIFDPAPMADAAGNLWMSHSSVQPSANVPAMNRVRTRIASSPDHGNTWTDIGVDPNSLATADFQVPDGSGGTLWATWRFEVSRLLYDPDDIPARRWKMLWHRVLAIPSGPIFQDSWVGLATAPAPGGPWSAERKLFTGTAYNATDMDAFIGAPEFPLAVQYGAQLGGCPVFTEPGMLARSDGIYVSLGCAPLGKIFLLRCDRAFSACDYRGELLAAGEAAQFSQSGQSLNGFSASELVDVGGTPYLIVTGYEPPPDTYRGCLVFRIADLATATVERRAGAPVLVKRVAGTVGSFNGACGYHPAASGSGIIYSEYTSATQKFHLFASRINLP